MDFFSRLFGKQSTKDGKAPVVKQLHTRSAAEVRTDNSLVSVYGAGGREIFLNREEWKTDILPHNQKKKWNNPDELSQLILTAMRDNLYEEILDGARQLNKIDSQVERGAVLCSIALIETGNTEEALGVLETALKKQTESAALLTMLARVHSANGESEKSKDVLWQALEKDPNHPNAVEWWASLALEESGEEGYEKSLNKIMTVKGSWRPLLWLGRQALAAKDFDKAIGCYQKIVAATTMIPEDVATQISGDLGKAGQLDEVIQLFGSPFKVKDWGILTGTNLVGAFCSLTRYEEASKVVEQLAEMNQPQWAGHIEFLKQQIKTHQHVE